ncbi:MAG: DNA primase [Clostridia bacterium]|nr:DNA primase [Clostridia bacterium]
MISQTVIEELKRRCPIEDVISSYVTLKRAGSNHNGLCPFHSEKTPSFTVFTGTSSFYCFGCGAGGDVISFIMRAENLEYREALEFLAKRAGIALPDDGTAQKAGVSRKRLYEMNTAAAKFFRQALFESAEAGIAREYLTKRGLSQAIIKRFGLGFADGSFNSLRDHLQSKGFTEEEMLAGFLSKKSEKNGTLYDIFREKVMFPIIDTAGNIVAFGGRVLDNSKPKYINSSDTPAFNKKRNLFALNYAKNSCADQLILCEGYMDVIALHEFGFENAVATLGTAITSEQARLISRHTKQVIITYDSDEAGQRAADKAFRLLDEVGVDTQILKVEGAKDPDEYLRKFGKVKF